MRMRNHYRYEDGDWKIIGDAVQCRLRSFRSMDSILVLRLCTLGAPADYARPIFRKGEAEWSIAPVEFIGGEFRRIPNADAILLTGAPSDINDHLATL